MKIRKIENEIDISNFIKSWEIIFERSWEKVEYTWLFNKKNNIYCAFDGNKIAAAYCLHTLEGFSKNKPYSGVLCNNVFVNGYHYSKKGLFTDITNFALNDAKTDYDFALGFPNKKAIKAHIRTNRWKVENKVPLLEYNKDLETIFQKKGDLTIEWLDIDSEESIEKISRCFQLKSNSTNTFFIRKSKEYLKWRFHDNPRCTYQLGVIFDKNILSGFFVSKFFKDRSRIHLVDYHLPNIPYIENSINEIFDYYASKNMITTVIDLWAASSDSTNFISAGFIKSHEFTDVIFCDLNNIGLSLDDEPHLVLADNDVY